MAASFTVTPTGEPLHVELSDGGLTIGIASVRAAREEHGLEVSQDGGAMEIVLWCEDVDAAYAQALAAGATVMEASRTTSRRAGSGWAG